MNRRNSARLRRSPPARSSGLTIIAVPLAFTLELAAHSNRPEIDLDGAFKGSLPPGSFWTLISANMFGTDGPLKGFLGAADRRTSATFSSRAT